MEDRCALKMRKGQSNPLSSNALPATVSVLGRNPIRGMNNAG
jgi:hypothetical protein